MNKVILIGNLVADPELRRTQSDVAVCTFRIGVKRRFADQSGTRQSDFFNIVAWRQIGELCGKYLSKGRKCAVVGSLQNRSYDAQDGTKRYVTEVIAEEVEFLSSGKDDKQSTDETSHEQPSPSNQGENGGFTVVDDDDLPF